MESNWISVEDRLPERDGKYLCRYGFVHEGKIRGKKYTSIIGYCATNPNSHWLTLFTDMRVTHWMPLPEPPEEENK